MDTGTTVGPYEIVSPLGSGGMGRVFRARDRRLGRDVALKFLHEAREPGAAARLLAEARAASALNHPNICQIYDVGESEHGSWIAMEFVPGESLAATIPPQGLAYETTVRLGLEIASALAHAHARGIVHRDLKAGNCVCATDGKVKVLDFGLAVTGTDARAAAITRTESHDSAPAGTLAYMAPEVLRGRRADERSDLWALGVLLYEMASGARPFSGATDYDIAASILGTTPAPLPDTLSPAFGAIVARLLEKDPQARYQTAAEVRAALEAIRGGADVPRHKAPPIRRRMVPLVMVAILVIAVAAATWSLFHQDRASRLAELQLISSFEGSHAFPSFSPDARFVAFLSPDTAGIAQVWVKDLAAESAPLQITSGGVAVERPRWHPNGDAIAFARRGQGIWTVPPFGGTPLRIIAEGFNPNYSRDGNRLVFETARSVFVAAADGSEPQAVEGIPPRYYSIPRMPALSPDGRQIVFFHPEAGPNGDFYLIPAAGGTPRRLTSDVREGGAPVWSPDGRTIVFSSARAGSRTLWQIRADGGEPQPLTTGAGEDDAPDLSSDGSRMIFTNVRHRWQLRLREAAGAERQLLERSTEVLFPIFSPDGTHLTFFGRSGWAVAIFTVAADGTDLRQLTAGRELNQMPRWSADGQQVFFYQILPEPGLRRVAAVGGPSAAVLPWDWSTHNAVQFDPEGRRLVYTRQTSPGTSPALPEVTVIRDVASGVETELPQPHLHWPRFSPDGRSIAGASHDGQVIVCSADGAACRPVTKATLRTVVAWSGDGTRLFFLRGASIQDTQQLWSSTVAGVDQRLHHELGRFRRIDVFFDLSVRGAVAWAPMIPGRQELWAASIR